MELLYNATIVNEGRRWHGYVVINGEFIEQVGEGEPDAGLLQAATMKVDLQDDLLLPGVIDEHVHFREPGMTHEGTIASESRAAVAGGVTSFMDMPNNVPPATTIERLEAKYDKAAAVSPANYSFYIGATNDNLDELKRVDYRKVCGVKAFLGSSTGNMLVNDEAQLRRLFAEVHALIAVHCEDEATIKRNVAKAQCDYGDDIPVSLHSAIRSEEACYLSSARTVSLARELGTRLHLLHVSTARELSLLSNAPVAQKRITAETCPHYLWLYDDYGRWGSRIKCNPAIKTREDRDALRRALADGHIDTVGTDHAPHLLAAKLGNSWGKVASGMPGVQFALPVMLELAEQGVLPVEKVVETMSGNVATVYRIDRRGYIRPGYYADLAVVHRCTSPWQVTDADAISLCKWTPYAGMKLHYKVTRTIVNGVTAMQDGVINERARGKRLMFNV